MTAFIAALLAGSDRHWVSNLAGGRRPYSLAPRFCWGSHAAPVADALAREGQMSPSIALKEPSQKAAIAFLMAALGARA